VELASDLISETAQELPSLIQALLAELGKMRRELALELGLVLPGIRLRDQVSVPAGTWCFYWRDRLVGRRSGGHGRSPGRRAEALAVPQLPPHTHRGFQYFEGCCNGVNLPLAPALAAGCDPSRLTAYMQQDPSMSRHEAEERAIILRRELHRLDKSWYESEKRFRAHAFLGYHFR